MLAVVHGLEKFHYYVYDRVVTVETDNKPLEEIFKRHLATAPPRIARTMLRIQKYGAEITYVQGNNVPLADALSRIITQAQQGLLRLKKKQPRMKYSSHFVQLSPKDGPAQDQITHHILMHSGITVTN